MVINSNLTGLQLFGDTNISKEIGNKFLDVTLPFPNPLEPVKITFLFSRENISKDKYKDREIFKDLESYLHNLCIKKYIIIHKEIEPGESNKEITQKLDDADIIIILPSLDFDHDLFCSSQEMRAHLNELAKNGVYIWPILLKSYFYEKTDCINDHGLFFSIYENGNISATQDDRYTKIVQCISREVDYMLADRCVRLGDNYMQQLDILRALDAYHYALTLIKGYPPAIFGKGCALYKQERIEEAIDCFKEVSLFTSLTSDNGLSSNSCKLIQIRNDYYRGRAFIKLESFQEASHVFQNICVCLTTFTDTTILSIKESLDEIHSQSWCGEGDVLMQSAESKLLPEYYKQAYMAYKKAYDLQPNCLEYLLKMGDAQKMLGDKSQDWVYSKCAKNHYEEAIRRGHKDTLVYSKYGDVLASLAQYEEALNAYNESLRLEKSPDSLLHEKKGYIFLLMQRPAKALESFERALALDNGKASFYNGKGEALRAIDQYEEALQAYELAQMHGPWSYKRAFLIMDILVALVEEEYSFNYSGKIDIYFQKASSYCQQLVPQSNRYDQTAIYCALGRIYFAHGDMGCAEIAYSSAINTGVDKADGYLGIARIGIQSNDQSKADKACSDAIRKPTLNTSMDAEGYLVFGDYFKHFSGEIGSETYYDYLQIACDYYKRAINLYSHKFKCAIAYERLGEAYKMLSREEDALVAFGNALNQDVRLLECYYSQGECCMKLKRYSEAYKLFLKALTSGFEYPKVRNSMGDALLKMGSYMDAIATFKDLIAKTNKHTYDQLLNVDTRNMEIAYAYAWIGSAYYSLDNEEAAIEAFIAANNYDPDIFKYPQYNRPLKALQTAINVYMLNHPYDMASYIQKGDILFILKRYKEACEAYMDALQSDQLSSAQITHANDMRVCAERLYVEYQKAKNLHHQPMVLGMQPSINGGATNSTSQHRSGFFDKLFNRRSLSSS